MPRSKQPGYRHVWNGRVPARKQERPLPFDMQVRPERAKPVRHNRGSAVQPYLWLLHRYDSLFMTRHTSCGAGLSRSPGEYAVVRRHDQHVVGWSDDINRALAYAKAATRKHTDIVFDCVKHHAGLGG